MNQAIAEAESFIDQLQAEEEVYKRTIGFLVKYDYYASGPN